MHTRELVAVRRQRDAISHLKMIITMVPGDIHTSCMALTWRWVMGVASTMLVTLAQCQEVLEWLEHAPREPAAWELQRVLAAVRGVAGEQLVAEGVLGEQLAEGEEVEQLVEEAEAEAEDAEGVVAVK